MDRQALKNAIKASAASGGAHVRHLLLAYALLRGVPYRTLELVTREGNRPSVGLLQEMTGCSLEGVLAWLDVPPAPELVERRSAERVAYMAKKRQIALRARGVLA